MDDLDPQQRLRRRAELAVAASSRAEIESLINDSGNEVLMALARNPHLQERDLLRLLERKDLSHEVVREVAHRPEVRRSYAVQLALVRHPQSLRQIGLPLLKFLYVFDLLRVAQSPSTPPTVQMAAEEHILKKLVGMPRGEKMSLARRGTGRIAAVLLLTPDVDLISAALDNPYLTEGHLVKVLAREDLPQALIELLTQHERWSCRYDLRLALIRHPLTPLARVLGFLPDMAVTDLRNICLDHRMPISLRKYIQAHCAARLNKQPGTASGGRPKAS